MTDGEPDPDQSSIRQQIEPGKIPEPAVEGS
jgi:hypothetical protein